MRNAGLEEAQAGIKIAGRNINNLRYADDSTLMAENEEELKRLLLKVKEESEKVYLKRNIQKTKITASGSITSVPRGDRDLGVAYQTHPGNQASSRGDTYMNIYVYPLALEHPSYSLTSFLIKMWSILHLI